MLYSEQNQFSAWVTIDGTEKTVTCWIASELGKKFSVHWKNSSYYGVTRGDVKMDGTSCGGKIVYDHMLPKYTHKDGVSDGMTLRPFMFSSLSLTDDDSFLGGSSHEQLGTIDLTIFPIEVTAQNVPSRAQISLSERQVHERSKKAVTQQITLATPEYLAKPETFVSTRRLGSDIVRFSFKYRPLDILQANGIAPAPPQLKRKAFPAPAPLRAQSSRADEDLADEDEAQTLRRKLAVLEAKRIKKEKGKGEEKKSGVKRENSGGGGGIIDLTVDSDGPRSQKRVKREERKNTFVSGEVIDLT
ncbi:hypothetical protein B0H11DRAFT_2075430 [Mycena galericulata]|nr:hypothetical protein B0H11DRAFT_2075430 [Mycena galericulata]